MTRIRAASTAAHGLRTFVGRSSTRTSRARASVTTRPRRPIVRPRGPASASACGAVPSSSRRGWTTAAALRAARLLGVSAGAATSTQSLVPASSAGSTSPGLAAASARNGVAGERLSTRGGSVSHAAIRSGERLGRVSASRVLLPGGGRRMPRGRKGWLRGRPPGSFGRYLSPAECRPYRGGRSSLRSAPSAAMPS